MPGAGAEDLRREAVDDGLTGARGTSGVRRNQGTTGIRGGRGYDHHGYQLPCGDCAGYDCTQITIV